MQISIGDRDYDFALALPITVGDWRQMEKLKLIDGKTGDVHVVGAEKTAQMILLFAQKIHDETTIEELDKMALRDIIKVAQFLTDEMGKEDDPSPSSSESSTNSE